MSFTVSHRQAGAQRSAVGGLVRHEFRDIDKHNGIETQHSNERIVPSRTHLNQSRLYVGGETRRLRSSRQILDELDSRLDAAGGTRTNKKTGEVTRVAVRKDAAVVRDLVLQLDPDFTGTSEELLEPANAGKRQQVEQLLWEMVDHYGDVYGRENLLAASLHWDETSPHVHLMVTPIDDEGRVRQESFIKAGRGKASGLAANDRAMRERLAARGYDVDKEPRGGGRSHLTPEKFAQWSATNERLEERETSVGELELTLGRRGAAVRKRQEALQEVTERQKRNKAWIDRQKAALEAREAAVAAREAQVAVDAQKAARLATAARKADSVLTKELNAARAKRAAYEDALQQVQAVAKIVKHTQRISQIKRELEIKTSGRNQPEAGGYER